MNPHDNIDTTDARTDNALLNVVNLLGAAAQALLAYDSQQKEEQAQKERETAQIQQAAEEQAREAEKAARLAKHVEETETRNAEIIAKKLWLFSDGEALAAHRILSQIRSSGGCRADRGAVESLADAYLKLTQAAIARSAHAVELRRARAAQTQGGGLVRPGDLPFVPFGASTLGASVGVESLPLSEG
jgi:hypothetical protein